VQDVVQDKSTPAINQVKFDPTNPGKATAPRGRDRGPGCRVRPETVPENDAVGVPASRPDRCNPTLHPSTTLGGKLVDNPSRDWRWTDTLRVVNGEGFEVDAPERRVLPGRATAL
jgi:hypothetical protein